MQSKNNLPIIFLLSLLVLAGCADPQLQNELRQAQEELRHLKEERAEREGKIEEAYETYDKLMRRFIEEGSEKNIVLNELEACQVNCRQLETEYRSLEERHGRILNWAKDMARGYGPGIWMYSEHDLPLYRKAADAPTVSGIVDEMNLYFRKSGNPVLIRENTENRTVYVTVSDEMKLVSGMGSYGANAYIQSVAFSLSSLENIDCVYFDIQEGDHAGPGLHCPYKQD